MFRQKFDDICRRHIRPEITSVEHVVMTSPKGEPYNSYILTEKILVVYIDEEYLDDRVIYNCCMTTDLDQEFLCSYSEDEFFKHTLLGEIIRDYNSGDDSDYY